MRLRRPFELCRTDKWSPVIGDHKFLKTNFFVVTYSVPSNPSWDLITKTHPYMFIAGIYHVYQTPFVGVSSSGRQDCGHGSWNLLRTLTFKVPGLSEPDIYKDWKTQRISDLERTPCNARQWLHSHELSAFLPCSRNYFFPRRDGWKHFFQFKMNKMSFFFWYVWHEHWVVIVQYEETYLCSVCV